MYFISRNNKIYHYIAHTDRRRRYFWTFMLLAVFFIGTFYGLQYIIDRYFLAYKQEQSMLIEKSEELKILEKNNRELISFIEAQSKSSLSKMQEKDIQALFKELLFFLLDSARKIGLTVHSYAIYKEKNNDWYVKQQAHCTVSGSMPTIVKFLENIKAAEKSISFYRWSLVKTSDDIYTFQSDVVFVVAQ